VDVEFDFGDGLDERILSRCDGGSELSATCYRECSFDVGHVEGV
jgi:hypothetical protein